MINDTFQEKEEATAKFQRAQLSSCQLPTYFIGWSGWLEAREHYKKRKGSAFQLRAIPRRGAEGERGAAAGAGRAVAIGARKVR